MGHAAAAAAAVVVAAAAVVVAAAAAVSPYHPMYLTQHLHSTTFDVLACGRLTRGNTSRTVESPPTDIKKYNKKP